MNLLSLIYLAPRRPAGPHLPVPLGGGPDEGAAFVASRSTEGVLHQVVSRSPDRDTPSARSSPRLAAAAAAFAHDVLSTSPPQQKYLPVIDTDRCIGCERCLSACDHGCLEMIWSFSTLTNPQTCTGEAHCAQACPEQIIRMAWIPVATQ